MSRVRSLLDCVVSLSRRVAGSLARLFRRLHDRLDRIWLFSLLERVILEFSEDEASMRAGAITYYVLQSLFPLLLGLVSLLGFFLPRASVRQAVSDTLMRILPGSSDFIGQTLDSIIALRGTIGIVSLLLLLWSGSNLFGSVRRALNRAWDVPERRQFFVGKAIDFAMVAGAGILLLLSVSANTVARFFDTVAGAAAFWVLAVGGRFFAFLVAFGLFLIVYKYIPSAKTLWRWTWPGALLSAVFFQAGAYVFIFYVSNFANFQSAYGSLGSVIIFLYWVYLSVEVLLLGAELNSELQRMSRGLGRGGTSGGHH